MKVSVLLGSVRSGRQSHKVAAYLTGQLHQRGIQADYIDLAELPLPIMGSRGGKSRKSETNRQLIGHSLAEADALLFVSPEYHGSYSGVLKNALDHFRAEFVRKPIGVVTVSSGKMGGINASIQLQHLILSLGAYALPLKLLIPEVTESYDGSAGPAHANLREAAAGFLNEFLWFADAIYQKKQDGIRAEKPTI